MKWEANLREQVKGITAEEVWPLLEDFCNLHKVFPLVNNSRRLDGEAGKPGLIRYCAFQPSPAGDIFWVTEKLLMIDSNEQCLRYEIVENNLGINAYVGTMKVGPTSRGDGEGAEEGCWIEWSVVADPMEGRTVEAFQSVWNSYLHSIVQTIQTLLSPVSA
ncbi:Polyketide cyclase/dehydrase and lipid transport superfamily protein [Euphorbia peplus]|nr:Polyketide cyclase/dehydrase and lipid transport superfamily protein [Euphorbia peplus]